MHNWFEKRIGISKLKTWLKKCKVNYNFDLFASSVYEYIRLKLWEYKCVKIIHTLFQWIYLYIYIYIYALICSTCENFKIKITTLFIEE